MTRKLKTEEERESATVESTKGTTVRSTNPTEHMSQSLYNSTTETGRWQPKYPFDLVITYEDNTTRNQAMQLYDHLAQTLLDDYDFQCTWWRFDHFRNPNLREQAADAAAEANMIIICLRTGEQLPQLVRSWIDAWLPRKDDRRSALVTLVGEVERTHRDSCPVNTYLQKIARVGHMDFFSHAFDGIKPRVAAATVETPPTTFDDSLRSRSGIPRWGINE